MSADNRQRTHREEEVADEILLREKRNRAFWKMLGQFVPRKTYQPPDQLVILSLGCGAAEEMRVITSYFSSGQFNLPTSRARYIGVDNDAQQIKRAEVLAATPAVTDSTELFVITPSYELHCGDARKLSGFPTVPLAVDVILLRHQFVASDVRDENNNWYFILKGAVERLAPNGICILTSFRSAENVVLNEVLKTLPCRLVLNEKNPHSVPLGKQYPGVDYDQWITLIKKG